MAEGIGDRFGGDVFPGVFCAVEEGGEAEGATIYLSLSIDSIEAI